MKNLSIRCVLASLALCLSRQMYAGTADPLVIPRSEFAKYYRKIVGTDVPEDAVRLAINPGVSKSGKDAYTIVSADNGIVITGSNLRSVFYGVYDFLERRANCHWFWDGDVVPRLDSIDFSGLNIHEEAHFEYRGLRYFAHRGLTRFQAEHWGLEDWKREIDWMLKRRLNVFMLRIGQDDLFQRAYPEAVGYPDPSKNLAGTGKGYDNRTLFWSLQYRGKLRKDLQQYAFARGLEVPEDFGTMTHWYSRTPEDFLEKFNPPFLPQATSGYKQRNGLVWDIRDDKWVNAYWKLTTTAINAYGKPGPGLLHTIGLGERLCYTNRMDNLKLKLLALDKFLKLAHREYPEKKVLLGGWDFYFTWYPDEVKSLVQTLDPNRDILWDYEGDATQDYRPEMKKVGGNNFTKWGVVGKFPYTYSIFLAFENALDIRANYEVIEKRQKIVQNDPMCKGFIFWPEASHTDTLCLRYFTSNAWSKELISHEKVLNEFCASRYASDAACWKSIWRRVLPLSSLFDWGDNYWRHAVDHSRWQNKGDSGNGYNDSVFWEAFRMPEPIAEVPGIFRDLSAIDWKRSLFTERDAIDLARTTGDRMVSFARDDLMRTYHAWKNDAALASDVLRKARAYAKMGSLMADVLALHTDYSLAESFDRMNAIEPVSNPNFPRVLVENAICNYCASHQYEAAEYWYKPAICEFADLVSCKVSDGDYSPIRFTHDRDFYRDMHMYAKPLAAMRPSQPRTQANYSRVMRSFADAASDFLK